MAEQDDVRDDLDVELFDYIVVFALSLVWLLMLSWFSMRRLKKRSILHGLRREFA